MRHFKQLTWTDRLKIEAWRKVGLSVTKIAEELGVHKSTISRELKRGVYYGLTTNLEVEFRYSPEKSEQKKQEYLRAKGAGLKIGNDLAYANYLEYKVCKEHYSPGAILGEIKRKNIKFNTTISKTTFYRYIDSGVFLTLTNKDLPIKRNKGKHKHRPVRAKRPPKGTSIEKRLPEIETRETFGHWEMDCVEGKKGTKPTLLVLTERKTRYELIRLMPDKTAASVVNAINRLERQYGSDMFSRVFQTITVDNGSEFMDFSGIEYNKKRKRTTMYYCHPYSYFERGSNENQNRMVRRHFPKGFDFTDTTQKQIDKLQDWINAYPRELFDFYSSADLYEAHLNSFVV